MKKNLDAFILGETVDLIAPSKSLVKKSNWHNWFNNDKFTKYLNGHNLYPNTLANQLEFTEKMINSNKKKESLYLFISEKNKKKIIGVAALSKIDWTNKSAYMSIVISPERHKNFIFNSVESKALLTKHAFEKFNLNKIRTSQVLELSEWQKYSFLLGYKVEGISKKAFLRNNIYYDVCFHSCLLSDFLIAKRKLGESLWPGKKKFFQIMLKLPKANIYKRISKTIYKENLLYEHEIEKLLSE